MNYYPLGELPMKAPRWLVEGLSKTVRFGRFRDPETSDGVLGLPLWQLDTESHDVAADEAVQG